ncbi:hypothetical protein LXA43DRAFT_1063368 [Ganoderma leucocontextum]|nr:hypothetical protein LXA43DRAFT_1063368 [Ganoderma leucocontextum]
MSSLDWKRKVQTFSDKNLQVYTVINLGPELSVPRGADPNFIKNKITPSAFLLRHDTPTDPLLARLFSSEDIFAPRQFAKGWGMTAETRDSWVQLEKGLSHIANLLVLLHNGLLVREIHDAPWWKTPEECGYRRLYKYKEHARWAIERSREALMVLAARCSLAIALWMPWTERAAEAQVPAFFIWKNKQYEEEWCKRLDWLNGYLSKGTDPNRARLSKPPRYFPNVYNFWRTGEWHVQPDMFTFTEDGNPPVGPFQLPGESREQFLQWAKSYHPPPFWDSIDACRRRQQRIERHNLENFPEPRALVYIWILMWLSFPNIPIKWRQLEYCMPTRYYNGHFDTWDVWTEQPPIPPRSAFDHIGDLTDVENDIKAIVELEPISNQLEGAEYTIEQSFEADDTFLNSGGPLSKFRITFTPTYLQDRFSLRPSVHTFPKLDYESKDVRKQIKFVAKMLGTFGSVNVPQELHRTYGAWVHTILNTEWKKLNTADFPDAVQECWDLDRRSPHYLLQPNVLYEVNLQAVDTVDSTRAYVITYDRDEGAQNWHLIVNPTVTAYLLRQLAHIKTAKVAANHLANIGAPFYIGPRSPVQ